LDQIDREAEITQLSAEYGTPRRERCALDVSQASHEWWSTEKVRRRDGEVVLFIQRRNGNLILHTKDFYPGRVLRVPSGGIKRGEAVFSAVHREVLEETSLQVAIERFLALVEFEFHWRGGATRYPSYSFLLREVAGDLRSQDPHERIAAFSEVPFSELPSVARELENVPASWRDWGQFRAIPHRLAAELMGCSRPRQTLPLRQERGAEYR
jgi:ADP-ribose pyrophosphatase YjhB (NUDIX family)